jgi:xanthine dehydrogenase accessory factor
MTERRNIVALARSCDATVLVTLVNATGSSYRRPGARLLVGGDRFVGTISGGCLEAEVVKKAAWKVRDGATTDIYSTLFDDTAEIPYGLGCGGTVTLLFELADTPEYIALIDALEASLHGASFTVVTWHPTGPQAFARVVLSSDSEVVFCSPNLTDDQISAALAKPKAPDIFVEHLVPPQRLIVLGAGDDARPVVKMAALLGWTVVVVDGRQHLAQPGRFPEAEQVFALAPSGLDALNLTSADAVVLMTHSYEQDRDWLAAVLPVAPLYFGVLGAKHRSSLLVSEAAAATGIPLATCCERIYAPVGLDLGGDGPEAIALAVIAEAHARCQGRLGSSLRLSAEDVAHQVARRDLIPYTPSQCVIGDPLS